MSKKTKEEIVSATSELTKEEECLQRLNEVLQEFQFALTPTFQLVPVKPKTDAETGDKESSGSEEEDSPAE